MRRLLILSFITVLMLASCTREAPVRIGSKLFAENQIIAEMLYALASDHSVPVAKYIPYGNTYALQQALRNGNLDIYPGYTGTGALIMGASVPARPEETLAAVRRLYEPLNISWLAPLGFENSYVIVLRPDNAALWNASSITDLAERSERLTIAADPEFLHRAVDGMTSLVRRYGITPDPEIISVEGRDKMYLQLLNGDADVVIGHTTDPQISEYKLVTMKDDQRFFPIYEAAPVVRNKALQEHPRLKAAIEKLTGRLDVETMRRLNVQVDQEGLDPKEVASTWLLTQGLLKERPPSPYQEVLSIAAPPMDDTPPSAARTLQAFRQVFPDRPVHLKTVGLPAESMLQGLAFAAVLGAEHFYEPKEGGGVKMVSGIEAVAPLNFRVVHLLTRKSRRGSGQTFKGIKRIGVGPNNGSSHRVARFLSDAYQANLELIAGNVEDQAAQAARGELDAVLLMAPRKDAGITTLLMKHPDLSLRDMSEWGAEDRQNRYPFFHLTKVAVGNYPGQDRPLETVGAQLVLAGPRAEVQRQIGGGGPVSSLQSGRSALPDGLKRRLADALGADEAVDPAIPGQNIKVVRRAPEPPQPLNPNPTASLIIAGFLVVMAGFFTVLKRAGKN